MGWSCKARSERGECMHAYFSLLQHLTTILVPRPRPRVRPSVRGGGLDSASQQVSSLCERELVACADATATEEERRGYRSSVRRVMTTTAPVELTARRRRLTVTGRPRERASLCRLFPPSSSSPLCHFLRHSSPPLLLLPLLLSLFFFTVYPSRCHSPPPPRQPPPLTAMRASVSDKRKPRLAGKREGGNGGAARKNEGVAGCHAIHVRRLGE